METTPAKEKIASMIKNAEYFWFLQDKFYQQCRKEKQYDDMFSHLKARMKYGRIIDRLKISLQKY